MEKDFIYRWGIDTFLNVSNLQITQMISGSTVIDTEIKFMQSSVKLLNCMQLAQVIL